MGYWGMGITQSDQYCEIYERFMEEYDEGKPLPDIKADILEEYLDQFNDSDGVLHDVYFAIGKAEWMCGGISDEIFEKITHIIHTGANLAFYKELEATDSDLKLRQKNLDKFLTSLSTPRGKTKKRKTPPEKYVKAEKAKLPPFRCGDVFAYEADGKYRVFALITRRKFYSTFASFCYVWTPFYEQIPSINQLTDTPIMPLGYFTVETFPDMEALHFIGNIPDAKKLDIVYPGLLYEKWKPATWAAAKVAHLLEEYPVELGMAFSECLERRKNLL